MTETPEVLELAEGKAEVKPAEATRAAVAEALEGMDLNKLGFEQLEETVKLAETTFKIRKDPESEEWYCANAAGKSFRIVKRGDVFKAVASNREVPPQTSAIGRILNEINHDAHNLKSGFNSLEELNEALKRLMSDLGYRLVD